MPCSFLGQFLLRCPVSLQIKELRGFLGLTSYYRKFVKGYGELSKPLTDLLQKKGFCWSEQAENAFNRLKWAMSHAPVLSLPDFTQPFTIETDASGGGMGAVLMQNKKPIAYLSKAFGVRSLGLSTYERELMALIMAVMKWRHYLTGKKFLVKTDHQSLRFLLEQQKLTTHIQHKGLTKLLGLDYSIQYQKGVDNKVADALSRRRHEEEDEEAELS